MLIRQIIGTRAECVHGEKCSFSYIKVITTLNILAHSFSVPMFLSQHKVFGILWIFIFCVWHLRQVVCLAKVDLTGETEVFNIIL